MTRFNHCYAIKTLSTILIVSVFFALPATAKNLGVFGKVWEITEPDMLEQMMGKLQSMQESGELDRLNKEAQERAKAYTKRPTGKELPRAEVLRTHYYNPSVTLPEAIKDADGRILYPPGTTVNPFDYMSLTRTLVFFDADDLTQKEWVWAMIKESPASYVTIMTNGPVIDVMKEWETRVYFDQRGVYVSKFEIESLPAVVRQEGFMLRIDEVPPETK